MKIDKAMILAAGTGTRMRPLTLETPKCLIKIHEQNLLEGAINLLIDHGVKEIVINVHYLAEKIKKFVLDKDYKVKIVFSEEKQELLDTGGGIFYGTKTFNNNPFIVLNPDTIWNNNYTQELKLLEKFYFKSRITTLLLVDKNLSFDSTFKGDFSLDKKGSVKRNKNNQYIFTGLQILDRSVFNFKKNKIFSMNHVWDNLINTNTLQGLKSDKNFYHINTKDMYDKIINLKTID